MGEEEEEDEEDAEEEEEADEKVEREEKRRAAAHPTGIEPLESAILSLPHSSVVSHPPTHPLPRSASPSPLSSCPPLPCVFAG